MTVTDSPRTSPRRRRAAAIGLAAAGVLALSGCMKTQYDITLNDDDTASMSVIIAISDEVAEAMGTDPQDMWNDSDLGADAPEGADAEPYAEDGYTGMRYTVDSAPIEEINSEELTIERVGDEYVVTGEVDLSDEESMSSGEDDATAELMMDTFVMQYSVTFPGAVADHNGTLDGTTVTWTPQIGEVTELSARGSAVEGGGAVEPSASESAEATDEPSDEATDEPTDEATEDTGDEVVVADDDATGGSGFPWWIIVVAVVVLGAAITGIVLLARRGSSSGTGPSTALPAGGTPGQGYPPPGYQGYQAPPPGYQGQGYQAPPQGYAPPPQAYQAPPPGYQAPPPGYQGQGYQAPPQGYAPPPEGYQAPPAQGAPAPAPAADQPTQPFGQPGAEQPTQEIPTEQPPAPEQGPERPQA